MKHFHLNSKLPLGIGMAAIGRPEYINIRDTRISDLDKSERSFKQNAISLLDRAYELGIRYFDTAASYGYGEQFLMDWISLRKHADIIIGTKWGYTYMANWELGFQAKHEVKEHSLEKLTKQWNFSKKFLPHLKIYQIHSATFESGVLTNKGVLKKLHDLKKAHHITIGLSCSGEQQAAIIEAALAIEIEDEALFGSIQATFNIFEQSCIDILKTAKDKGLTIIIKEALANGRLLHNQKHQQGEIQAYLALLAEKYEVGIDAIALQFCISMLQPFSVLSGAANIVQLNENFKANEFELTKDELLQLTLGKMSTEDYWNERKQLSWN